MFRLDAGKRVHFCVGVTRRDVLHAGALGFLGLTMPEYFELKAMRAVNSAKDVNYIQLILVGGLDVSKLRAGNPAQNLIRAFQR